MMRVMKSLYKIFLFCFAALLFISLDMPAQDQEVFQSVYLDQADTVWIFTPASTENTPDGKYPLIFLLHGWSGNYRHWDLMIDCQDYADRYGWIIVCPDGLYDSWYINSPVKSENQYRDFFFQDLYPFVMENYHVNPETVFITGLSMGGHGALYLFAQHPGKFKSAGSISGLLQFEAWKNHYALERVLGLDEEKIREGSVLRKYSVMGNLGKISATDKAILVSCGTEDPFYDTNLRFVDSCRKYDIRHIFSEGPGAHNSDYWRREIDEHFEFFRESIRK